jgi:hypothetical protein
MFGRVFLLWYRIVVWRAEWLPREHGYALRARWALRLSGVTTAGLDDDFAAEVFELVREMPALLDQLERQASGDSRSAQRKRLLIACLRRALAEGVESLY